MSSFRVWGVPLASAAAASLKSRFENMFCVTKIMAARKAYIIPNTLPLNSAEHASITPSVSGMRERYVEIGYRISKMTRYAKTVNSGESPLIVWTRETGILPVAVAERR